MEAAFLYSNNCRRKLTGSFAPLFCRKNFFRRFPIADIGVVNFEALEAETGAAYLASWAAVMLLGVGGVSMPVAVIVAMSGAVVVLGAPAFALAMGVERYVRGRLDGRGC